MGLVEDFERELDADVVEMGLSEDRAEEYRRRMRTTLRYESCRFNDFLVRAVSRLFRIG